MSVTEPRDAQEVDASRRKAADAPGSTPRDRVTEHLEKLLRGVTAVGTGVLLGWATRADAQRPPQVCDPLPPPVNCKVPDDFSVGRCLAQQTRWARVGTRLVVESTVWLLQVGQAPWEAFPALTEPPPPRMLAPGEPALPVSFARVGSRDVTVRGGVAESVAAASNRIDVRLRPAKGVRSVTVAMPDPSNAQRRITVVLDVSQAPKEGQVVPARLVPDRR